MVFEVQAEPGGSGRFMAVSARPELSGVEDILQKYSQAKPNRFQKRPDDVHAHCLMHEGMRTISMHLPSESEAKLSDRTKPFRSRRNGDSLQHSYRRTKYTR